MNTWQKKSSRVVHTFMLMTMFLVSACGGQIRATQSDAINVDTIGSLTEIARYGDPIVRDLIYSKDGKLLYLVTSVGVQILDVVTLDERGLFGADRFYSDLAISPDGRLLATLTTEMITVWQLQEENATELYNISTAEPDSLEFRAVAFHPETGQLWTVEGGYPDLGPTIISRRQPEQGNVVETQEINPPSTIFAFAIAPRTGLVAGSLRDNDFNGDVLVWDANTGTKKYLLENHQNFIGELAFSPDEQYLASASGQLSLFSKIENRVTIWNVATGRKFDTYDGHNAYIYKVAFNPESGDIASADDEGRILWWGHTVNSAVGSDTGVLALAFSPDGSHLAAAAQDGSIQVFSADGSQIIASRERNGSSITDMDVSKKAGLFVTSDTAGKLRLWEIGTDQPVAVLDKGRIDRILLTRRESFGCVAISPDANSIVAYEWPGRNLVVWQRNKDEAENLLKRPVLETAALRESVSFSADGDTFVTLMATYFGASVEIWQLDQDEAVFQITEEYQEQSTLFSIAIAISPDEKWLAYGLPTGEIKIRSMDGGDLKYTLTSNEEPVTAIDFAPSGKTLLSATNSGTLTLWNLEDGSVQASVTDDKNHWREAVFSPHGSLIALGSSQGMAAFYDTGLNEIFHLNAHSREISSLAFSADGMYLLSSSLDGTIRQWGIKP